MSKPDIIRKGDLVRVVVPRAVARVGYQKSPADYLAAVCEKHEATLREIYGFKQPTTLAAAYPALLSGSSTVEARVSLMKPQLRRALWDLAYLACKRDGFGGKERRVHLTDPMKGWSNVEFEVGAVRSVVEGDHYSSSYRTHWDGAREEIPGGLTDRRVRRLAAVGYLSSTSLSLAIGLAARRVEFPVEHLAKVQQ